MSDNEASEVEQDATPAAEQSTPASEPDKGDEKDWAAEAEKWKAHARKWEGTAKQNADAAKRLQEIENSQKSETQKLNDALAEREVELQELRVERIRSQAGQAVKLDPDLWEFITATDPDEALAQAKKLLARTAPPEPSAANLRQGARTQAKPAASPNDLLRSMAGYQ